MRSERTKPTKLLTVTEVASLLRVPINTVYFWVYCSKIPYLKIGRHLRFESETILNYFREKTLGDKGSRLEFERWSLKTRMRTVAESGQRS